MPDPAPPLPPAPPTQPAPKRLPLAEPDPFEVEETVPPELYPPLCDYDD